MRLTVTVTQKHIDAGQPVRCRLCPIALAINEQHPLPDGQYWASDWENVHRCTDTGGRPICVVAFDLPPAAREFVREFDCNTGLARPFSFDLEA